MQATSAALEGGLKWRKKNRQIFGIDRQPTSGQLGITQRRRLSFQIEQRLVIGI
ncbi:hypothetical protein FHW37_103349 [Neorhizobium alkalisoli]|uniref:Uncharacterized protein n=1 Tax=Neorhizobium alkalisoli TaxID=528178 RepID=A0A561QVV3_9HYPH|nr:hypothetical protein FHW37_103349 [Neorhizobium alkalisoli]